MDKQPVIKVQLNSVEALKSYLDSNPELELQIKNTVINSLCRDYIKGIAQNQMVLEIVKVIQEEIQKSNFFGLLEQRGGMWRNDWVPSKQLRKVAEQLVNTEVEKLISDTAKSIVQEHLKTIEASVQYHMDLTIKSIVKKNIEAEASKMVNELIRTKLLGDEKTSN